MQTNQETSAVSDQDTAVASTPSALERRIDMSVPLAEVDKDVDQRLKQMSRTVKMPGFRPGKVPFKMVTQQYGHQARSEAIGAVIEKQFAEVVREQKLRIAGYPRFEPKMGDDNTVLSFTAVFEVYPEINLADISGREVAKAVLPVTDAEVDKTFEVLRKQRTTFSEAARAAADGDRVVIDFTGRRDGEEFPGGQGKDFPMLLGGGQMLADFENAVRGLSAGETKTFDLTFPEDYQAQDLAGKTVQFELTVKRVEAPQLPELNDEFAKSLGIENGSMESMRKEVRENLEREVKKRLEARTKREVMDLLLSANPIEVPRSLVDHESRQMAELALRDLESRGMSAKNIPVEPSWFTEQAKRRVSLGLLIAELVKDKQLYAKPEQVRSAIEEFASTYEDPAEVVRWYYSQPQRLAEAESLVLESNVVNWVVENAKAVDTPVAFDELMSNNGV